jgi:hypothetical protein
VLEFPIIAALEVVEGRAGSLDAAAGYQNVKFRPRRAGADFVW